MAGHSKWANIKHRKAAQDAKRGKIFTKLIREITVAARAGGPDADSNPRLRAAIDKALGANMTRDTIDRAIKRGAGGDDGANLDEVVYEGYGPNGVAVMVECMTDNRNRTVADVRHAFSKCGGNLGTNGSVAYLFEKKGQVWFDAEAVDEDAIMEVALDTGAEDVISEAGSIEVQTTPENFGAVVDGLKEAGHEPESAEVSMVASTTAALDAGDAAKLLRLVDMLEDLDDSQNVYTNADISEEVMAQLG